MADKKNPQTPNPGLPSPGQDEQRSKGPDKPPPAPKK